ncbi:MAG: Rrf2 family transcriptional regulator [Oscillospiraceae bacterium]|nr:Rrf2 family transcriptional regulator [Oscillospiraceae bacterium]
MLISREFDYAIRILRALCGKGRRTVGEICDVEHIPQAYAYKIIKKLEKSGVLSGHRGKQGGYELATPLSEVTLYGVYQAVEGRLYINQCLKEGYLCPNNVGGQACNVHRALDGLQEEFATRLDSVNIQSIL